MFANRDEALKCIRLAEKHMREGRAEAAKKFIRKAVRLDPSVTLPSFASGLSGDGTPPRQRTPSRSRETAPSSTRENSQERHFTKTDVEAVRSVLTCNDLYKVLGVSKDASEDEIKRAYKSLARKFHPDKNRAPGATEAFKKIGSAFATLTNSEKRRRYDLYGSVDEPAPSVTRQRHGDVFYQFDGHPGFDADVFNIFFNGGFPFVYRNHRAQTHQPRESERESTYLAYVQILPLLILFGLSFFSNLFVKDAPFSLTRTTKYPVERVTNQHHVNYYVKPTFSEDFDGNLAHMESQVEEQYVYYLRDRCYKEQNQREALMHRARYLRDADAFQRAKDYPTPSCARLTELYG